MLMMDTTRDDRRAGRIDEAPRVVISRAVITTTTQSILFVL